MKQVNSRSKALAIARLTRDKKAEDIVILDMRKISSITDFFIILSGNSTRQVKALTDYIIEKAEHLGYKIWHVEGYHYALWVLLDLGDVVVHLFHQPIREFYSLERLWADAPMVKLDEKKTRQG